MVRNSLPETFILDTWPVIEWLQLRPHAQPALDNFWQQATRRELQLSMSRINFGETIYTIRKAPTWPEDKKAQALHWFTALPIILVSATDERVDQAVDLKSRYNISFADSFAAALAIERSCQLVTGDREFRALEDDGLLHLHWVGL